MELIDLTKKLISIPSFLDEKTNEKKMGDFVFNYLKEFSFLKVKKQMVDGDRFNIIAETKGDPRLFFAGHIDTVQPKQGWKRSQFTGEIDKDKLFGLGSADTKSGVAALLHSLNDFKDISGLTMLFYCDEEYDFKGMKKFISSYKKKVGKFAIFIEPTGLKICNVHRGIIEIKITVTGKTGHAKNPKLGNNAILSSSKAIKKLEEQINYLSHEVLGESSMNIAFFRGGLNLGNDKNGDIIIGKEGNNIADFAEFIIDIRPAVKNLNASKIVDLLKQEIEANGCSVERYSVRHDYQCLYTDRKEIIDIEKIIRDTLGKLEYLPSDSMGYAEAPFIQNKYNIPVIYLGPKGGNTHGADEWVNINSIKSCRNAYKNIILDVADAILKK